MEFSALYATDETFDACFTAGLELARGKYGLVVTIGPMDPPFFGDLDGREIWIIDTANSSERLFLLLHLFGHTVQWNTSPDALRIAFLQAPIKDPALLAAAEAYELEASAYASTFLEEAGFPQLRQWFSDYARADIAYLIEFYETETTEEVKDFWVRGKPMVELKPVPAFTPRKVAERRSGRVV